MQKAPETQAFDAKISRQRLDEFERPDGSVEAVLTVTLAGVPKPFVFREVSTPAEARAEFGAAEVSGFGEASGIFDDIGKAIGKVGKGVVKAVKSVASSKVFKTAAKGLAIVAPALGPLAPAALTTSGAMLTTSQLVSARGKSEAGDKKGAAKLTALAASTAKKVAPKNSAALLKIAADKSRAAHKIAVSAAKPASKKTAQKVPAAKKKPAAAKKPAPVIAPKLGTGSAITSSDLLAAARSGRVFVVRAA